MQILEVLSTIALIVTAFAVIWYTKEASKLRKISNDQKDLQLLPAFMLYIREQVDTSYEGYNYKLVMRNIGFGTAVAVQISPTIFDTEGNRMEFIFSLADQNSTLISGEEREVYFDVYKNNQPNYLERGSDFDTYFNPSSLEDIKSYKESGMVSEDAVEQNDVHIIFKDIKGQDYETVIGFRPEGIIVSELPKRF